DPDYTLGPHDYFLGSDLSLSGSSKINIAVTGQARLFVTGNLTINGIIVITNAGASLQLYVGGSGTKLGTVNSSSAKSFQYFGLPSNKALDYNGGDDFK